MADQIVILKNGERIICDLQEVFEGEGDQKRGICLLMTHPYILELVSVDNPSNPVQDLQVKFSKWCPYSVDYQFRIPYDNVMAIGEPDQGLAQAYRQKVETIAKIANEGDTMSVTGDIPQWKEGETNPNLDAQRADIEAVRNGINIEKKPDASVSS
ncbi:hypothetical protein S-PM2d131 [Synechococcus phage S-PM2]|uniref:Hypothetical-Protein / belonging to T4-LIKE GC: 176 n=1 Tax=Synechococcus phage S-PM2 TaxID=238854 RepID=Q5GQK6_BPSYP|nr:Hypothetical-Protein / belonging to T4-LIKE GC: 176 [Synechococcus phage S-PM2]CAF34196.1 Hypothetical-Protein / belonging to T4-LIKE GC: 176 [Synechococcus phage S-PM2]CFW42313.1 hypothetical protein S-PM2d131 [Synechococcus phage S-PM2]